MTEQKKYELPELPDQEEIDAIIACLGDDETMLRDAEFYEEVADNMAKAGKLIEALLARASIDADRAARAEPVRDSVIAGALFDLMGMLTTMPDPVTFSGSHEAGKAVELLQEFAKKRGLSLDEADVRGWNKRRASPPASEPEGAGERTCNDDDCGWQGDTDRMIGSIGPVCPKCGETTTEQSTPVEPEGMAVRLAAAEKIKKQWDFLMLQRATNVEWGMALSNEELIATINEILFDAAIKGEAK